MQKKKYYHVAEKDHSYLIWNDFLVDYIVWFFYGEFCIQTQTNMNQVVDNPITNNGIHINLDG